MREFVAVAALLWLTSTSAEAVSLCNCCAEATAGACTAACDSTQSPAKPCGVTVDYAGTFDIGPGKNPLYDITFDNLQLGSPTPAQLESFRRFLEQARLGAEADRRAALRDRAGGKIDAATADRMAQRYDHAMVNYYLGQEAYRTAIRR